jgi:uncharacterized membrane protein
MNEDPINFWQHVHGATTHFPIALAIVAVAFDLGALLFRKESWRTVGFWTTVAALVSAVVATASGLYYIYVAPAGKAAYASGLTQETVLLHRNLALAGTILLVAAGLTRVGVRDRMPKAAYVAYVLVALGATALIGYTGYKGAYVQRGY